MNLRIHAALLIGALGCTSDLTDGATTDAKLRDAVAREVPRGTPVDSAIRRLERHGFDCASMGMASVDAPPALSYNYLSCSKATNPGGTGRAWVVDLEHTGGRVDSVRAASVRYVR